MAFKGTTILNQVSGQRITFVQTAQDTKGERMVMDEYVPANGQVDQAHIHPRQEETFTVCAGTMEFTVNGQAQRAEAGQSVVVPAGVPHAFANVGEGEAVMRVTYRPALNTEGFFESFFGLSQDDKLDAKTGLPNLLQIAVLATAFREEILFAGIPLLIQRALFGALAPIGRLLGYRAPYPYPFTAPARRTQPSVGAGQWQEE